MRTVDVHSFPPLLRTRIEEVLFLNTDGDFSSPAGGHIHISFLDPVIQNGPQCGLTALSMASQLLGVESKSIAEIFDKAKKLGITIQGEIFSANWLCQLASSLWPVTAEVIEFPSPDRLVELILNGDALLVPYDCDKNHEPALKNGHSAHWAILVGFLAVERDIDGLQFASKVLTTLNQNAFHVFAYHGKSRHIGLWLYNQLRQSSNQLFEPGSDRKAPGYVIPGGGLGELRGKCVSLEINARVIDFSNRETSVNLDA